MLISGALFSLSKGGECDYLWHNVTIDCLKPCPSTGFTGVRAYAISRRSTSLLIVISVLSSVNVAGHLVRVGIFRRATSVK